LTLIIINSNCSC